MKAQSLDFIVGCIFARVDESIFKHFYRNNCKGDLMRGYCIPKIWFGLTCSKQVTNDITGDIKYLLRESICSTLKDSYPKLDVVCERIVPDNQYIRFDFRVKPKDVIKKMTIEEIEKELGYKVEIVSDNNA